MTTIFVCHQIKLKKDCFFKPFFRKINRRNDWSDWTKEKRELTNQSIDLSIYFPKEGEKQQQDGHLRVYIMFSLPLHFLVQILDTIIFSEKQTGTNSSKQANINTENAIKIKDEWMNVHHDTRRANQIKHLKHFFFVYVFKIVRTIVIRSIDQKFFCFFWHTFITNYDICEFFFVLPNKVNWTCIQVFGGYGTGNKKQFKNFNFNFFPLFKIKIKQIFRFFCFVFVEHFDGSSSCNVRVNLDSLKQ